MNVSITANLTTYQSTSADQSSVFLNMEQEYIPESSESASMIDALNMLGLARTGKSALSHITSSCDYVRVTSTSVIVDIGFYVWPSSLDMPYTLSADTGNITNGIGERLNRSFDVVIDGTDSHTLDFLFEGSLSKSMPFFKLDGSKDTTIETTVENNIISTSEKGYCVFRARGNSIGYYHVVTMVLPKTQAQKITNFKNSIIAEWENSSGEKVTTTLQLSIPQCVTDALEECGDDLAYEKLQCGAFDNCDETKKRVDIYYNACDGETILDENWLENT